MPDLQHFVDTDPDGGARFPIWQPIETAPRQRKIIVGYRNSAGKWRSVMGCYYARGTLNDYEGYGDDPDGWADEGWYEESETHEEILPTNELPTHWMPLPTEPK